MEEALRKESDYIGQVSFCSYWRASLSALRLSLQIAWQILDNVLSTVHLTEDKAMESVKCVKNPNQIIKNYMLLVALRSG